MADNIVDSLFGPQPWQVQQQQNAGLQQFAAQQANRDPLQMAKYGLTMGGGMLAGAGMEAAGYANPATVQAQQRQAVMQTGGDMSTAAGLKAKAAEFAAAGDQQTAMKLVLLARKQEAEEQKQLIEQRKQILGERKQEFQEQDAMDFKRQQLQQAYDLAKERAADARLSSADRVAAQREATQARLMMAQMMADSRRSAAEAKASAPKPISTVDARSIDKSMAASSGANSAMQLLDQADALYGQYASGRDEPILGGVARWGATVGLADPKRTADYEIGGQIAKDLGVIKLGLIGGSDTERELQIAIDTSPSPDKLPSTNRTIIANQRRAIEVLQSEPDFKTEWVNRNGSLSKLDKDSGEPYGKAWRKYQQANFKPAVIPGNAGTSKAGKPSNVDGIPTSRTFKVLGKEPG